MMRRILIPFLFVTCGFVGGMVLTGRLHTAEEARAEPRQTGAQPFSSPAAAGTLPDLSAVAARTIPSVMNIASLQIVRSNNTPFASDPLFRYFFGDQMAAPRSRVAQSLGSGVIVSNDGYILTNNHVVADADKVTVTLFDKRQYEAKVIGRDPTTDVAVIKIDQKNLPTLSLGDDANARVGQWVLAIGNPLQLNFTVTAGIVSAKGRNQRGLLNNQYAITDYIQTDAAINPGNSGGPLLNIHGDVIGINSAIASGTGYYAGYGFAIPITLAKQVMDDLIKFGKARRAVVGVSLDEVSANDARAAGLSTIGGAKVQGFTDETSPAAKAGMQVGDIIVAAAGHPVDQVNTLQRIIRGFKPGDNVDIDVMRFGQKKSFSIKLGEPAEAKATVADAADDRTVAPVRDKSGARQYDKLGLSVSPVSSEFANQLQLTEDQKTGLQITKVAGNGPGHNNLFQGEIIVSELYPTKRAIRSAADLDQAVAPLKTGDVLELIVCTPDPQTQKCVTRAVSIQVAK
jgi:serine protease Do